MKSKKYLRKIVALLFLFSIQLFAQGHGKIHGTIVDESINDVLPGANLLLVGTALGAASDINGEYRIVNIPAGKYKMRVSYVGYQVKIIDIEIFPNKDLELDISLNPVIIQGEEVVVKAQFEGQTEAINQQLTSDEIKNIVSATRLQEIPDANIAESIARLPGVSLTRESGEGSGIIIRGLAPKFNKVTVNGIDVASSEAGDRSSNLSMISGENLAGVEVFKAVLPNMSADAIGGVANMVLSKAKNEPVYMSRWYGAYTVQENDFAQYKGFARMSQRFFDNSLGVQASINIERKNLSRDRLTANFTQSTQLDSTIIYDINNVSATDRIQIRKRYGATLQLDYGDDKNSFMLWNFFSRKDDDIVSNSHSLGGNSSSATIASTVSEKINDMLINSLGGKHNILGMEIDWKLSHSFSINKIPYTYRISFAEEHSDKPDSRLNPEDFVAQLTPDSNATYGNFTNYLGETSDRRFGFEFNTKIPFNVGNSISTVLQFGAKYQIMKKKNENDYYTLEAAGGTLNIRPHQDLGWWLDRDYKPENFLNGKSSIGITLDPDRVREYYNLVKNYDNFLTSKFYGPNDDYEIAENTTAAYIMSKINYKQLLTFIGGVRYEGDDNSYTGYYRLQLGGNPLPTGKYEKQEAKVKRDYWFPMATLRIKPLNWFDIRLSATRTLSRPDFLWLINSEERSVRTGTDITIGVPDLKPAISKNFDIYFSIFEPKYGLFTLGFFYKSIDNISYRIRPYISNEEDAQRWGLQERDGILTQRFLDIPVNAPGETIIKGFEIDLQANLMFLPGILKGFVLHGNYSRLYSDSFLPFKSVTSYYDYEKRQLVTIHKAGFRKGQMPGQAEDLINLTLGYDYEDFSIRATYYRQGESLDINGVGVSPDEDRYVDPFSSVEISAKYKVSDNFSVLLNGSNITSSPTSHRQAKTPKYRLYENYGAFYNLGIELGL